MVLIFQSMWVAVRGFGRYLLLLPLVMIQIWIFTTLASMVFPFAAGIIGGSAFFLYFMFAMRNAYATLGEDGPIALRPLIWAGLAFSFFEGIVVFLLVWLGVMGIFFADGLTVGEIAHVLKDEGSSYQVGPIAMLVLIAGLFLGIGFLHAAMMVPMAAVAWSASTNKPDMDFFYGFGASLFPLTLIFLISLGLQIYFMTWFWPLMFFIWWIFTAIGLMIGKPPEAPDVDWLMLALSVGANLLLYYWKASAAAVAFLKRRERQAAEIKAERAVQVVDARSLRKARDGARAEP